MLISVRNQAEVLRKDSTCLMHMALIGKCFCNLQVRHACALDLDMHLKHATRNIRAALFGTCLSSLQHAYAHGLDLEQERTIIPVENPNEEEFSNACPYGDVPFPGLTVCLALCCLIPGFCPSVIPGFLDSLRS